ncbi:hypothetical protein V6Z11_A08G249800 [Gossypium hirsutum]
MAHLPGTGAVLTYGGTGVAARGYGGWGCCPVVAHLLLGLRFAKIWFSIWAVWANSAYWALIGYWVVLY